MCKNGGIVAGDSGQVCRHDVMSWAGSKDRSFWTLKCTTQTASAESAGTYRTESVQNLMRGTKHRQAGFIFSKSVTKMARVQKMSGCMKTRMDKPTVSKARAVPCVRRCHILVCLVRYRVVDVSCILLCRAGISQSV